MPELDEGRVSAWFQRAAPGYGHDFWPPPIREIEQKTPDPLAELGRALDTAAAADPEALRRALYDGAFCDDLRSALAQLGAARLLRLVHWLGEQVADQATIQVLLGGGHAEAGTLRAVIDALIRQTTLGRLFDRSRIEALAAAVATARQERG